MTRIGSIFALAMLLCSCNQTPPPDTACWVKPQTFQFASAAPARLYIKMDRPDRWCGYGAAIEWGSGKQAFDQARLTAAPAHGVVVLRQEKTGPMFFYRPAEGFTGDDQFEVEFAGGGRRLVLVNVRNQ